MCLLVQLQRCHNNMNLEFLKSTRFWAMVVGAVSIYLKSKGIFGEAEMMLVATITAGFTIIRTADRATEVLSNRSLPVEEKE